MIQDAADAPGLPKFLDGGGGTAEAIAALDWSATPLGARNAWPQALKTSVATMVRSPAAMALLWGPEGTLIYNDGYAAICGDRHPGALGRSALDVWPEAREFNANVLRRVLAGERLAYKDLEFSLHRRGRLEPAWFTLNYSCVLDAHDAPAGVLALVVETTDRMTAERTLRTSDERHRQIIDSAVDYAIVAFDVDGRITLWNEGAYRLFGWTEHDVLGQSGDLLFTPEDRDAGRLATEMREAEGAGTGSAERWHVRKSLQRFRASGQMTPIRGDGGRTVGYVMVLRDLTDQHRAERRLHRSEVLLRRAQQAGGVGTFTVDLGTDRLEGTPEFFRLFGLEPAAAVPASAVEALVVPEDAHVRSSAATRGSPSAPLDVEYRIRRASDGALRWIARRAEYERDAAGRPVRMVGVVQDITDRKAAQAALQASAAQFEAFAQALPSQVWTALPDGRLEWFNDTTYDYSGAPRGALDGSGWERLVHPDDLPRTAGLWADALASGARYETEFRVRRADGIYRWHLVRAIPLRSADGAVTRWIGANTDIDERKLAEDRSTRDRDRIWTLSQELMLVCDFAGKLMAVNPAVTRVLGWPESDLVGRQVIDLLHADDVAASVAEMRRLEAGGTTLSFENRFRTPDGTYRLLNWTAVPEGGLIHAVGRDVTRERAAEEAMRQSQKMEAVGQLTGGVAHDFNNLLTIISTSVDLLRRKNLPEDRRQRFMESISNAVKRATRLTSQLLAFARRQALQPVVFDAVRNVRAISEMIGTLVGPRIDVVVDVPAVPCSIDADPNQFDTAVINMAVNARDAMAGAGKLTIRIEPVTEIPGEGSQPPTPGAFVAVSLADTGAGIPPDQLGRIFEPFFTTKPVGLGTGLGLSQVFGFAKQSSGDVRVRSTPGQGATFTLYLPQAAHGSVQAADADAQPVEVGGGSGACVLVVEDNAAVAASVEETLVALGYITVTARNAAEALAALAHQPSRYAAVFSDVVMAGMDGIGLAREIRRRRPALPVLLSSGYAGVLADEKAHGFALLPKPYSLESLASALRDAIAQRPAGAIARRPPAAEAIASELAATDAIGEAARLSELDSLLVLDTEEEQAYDDLTRLAATLCNTPVALISLIDSDRQWFKSRLGLQVKQTPREHAFCAHAIRAPDRVMVVNDATQDGRFVDNALVTGTPNIRFYAGAPLVTSAGHALGTLCVIDYEAREIDPKQLELLQFLAAQVVERLEQRRRELAGRVDGANDVNG